MSDVIARVVPYAIACDLSPIALIALILLLFSAHAKADGIAFVAAWILTLAVALGLLTVVSDVVLADTPANVHQAVVAYFKVVLGGLALVLGARQLAAARRDRDAGSSSGMPRWMRTVDSLTLNRVFGLAALLAFVGNLPWLLAGGTEIGRAGLPLAQAVVVVIVFVVVGSLSTGGIVLFYVVRERQAQGRLGSWRTWLSNHNQLAGGLTLLVLAAFLIVGGVQSLIG